MLTYASRPGSGRQQLNDSASLWSSSLQCVVVLSSLPPGGGDTAPESHTKANWNKRDVGEISELSIAASQLGKYRASTKVLGEHITWDLFAVLESGSVGWRFATLFLPWVFGPVLGMRLPDDIHQEKPPFIMRHKLVFPGTNRHYSRWNLTYRNSTAPVALFNTL